MPRAVQINTSQNNTNEDEQNETLNSNTNTTERTNEDHLKGEPTQTSIVHGQASIHETFKNLDDDEEEPYSLRCVVGGKIKLYKKDSRVWLHKSSAKGKRKPDETEQCCGDVLPIKIAKFEDDEIKDGFVSIELREKSSVGRLQRSAVTHSSGSYNLYRHTDIDINSDLSSLGDSDADLTYSEATTPEETPSEEGKSTGFSVSCESNEATDTRDLKRLQQFVEANLKEEVKRNSDTLGNLDIGNESSNNMASLPTKGDITRRIAPAIDIEDESVRESLLDYAVNRGNQHRTGFHRVAYFTRSASKAKAGKHPRFKTEMKAKNKLAKVKSVRTRIPIVVGYNLRRKSNKNMKEPVKSLNTVQALNTNTINDLSPDTVKTVDRHSSKKSGSKSRGNPLLHAITPKLPGENSISISKASFNLPNTADDVTYVQATDIPSGSRDLPCSSQSDSKDSTSGSSNSTSELSESQSGHSSSQSWRPSPKSGHSSSKSGHSSPNSGHSNPNSRHSSPKSGQSSPKSGNSSPKSGCSYSKTGPRHTSSEPSESKSGIFTSQSGHFIPPSGSRNSPSGSYSSESGYSCCKPGTSGQPSRHSYSNVKAGSSKEDTHRHPLSLLFLSTMAIVRKDDAALENKN